MSKLSRKISKIALVLIAAGMFGLAGCSGISEEQIAELEALRAEVTALEKESAALKSEKTKLEREIAEKNTQLKQCAQDKEETLKNLEKLPK